MSRQKRGHESAKTCDSSKSVYCEIGTISVSLEKSATRDLKPKQCPAFPTGKTHLATALAIKACQQNMSVLFTTVPRLLTQIRESRSQKTLTRLEQYFEKYDLVVCDEFGYVSCDKDGGELLFNHLSLRAGKKATIITTNLAFNRWNEIIKDKVLVAALVDRLTHKAIIVNMTGDSYRLKETKKEMEKIQKSDKNN